MTVTNHLPHELHPELTPERLEVLAAILRNARHECLDEFNEKAGDTAWSYGCRARDWARAAFRRAVASGEYPWLDILEDSGQRFVLSVKGVPLKFFKDDPEEPGDRVHKLSVVEAAQGSLFQYVGMSDNTTIAWRLLVETGVQNLMVTRIVFVGLNQFEETVSYYNVPLDRPVTKLYEIGMAREEGVELPPAAATVKKKVQDDAEDDAAVANE
jgi:hypothetical protein